MAFFFVTGGDDMLSAPFFLKKKLWRHVVYIVQFSAIVVARKTGLMVFQPKNHFFNQKNYKSIIGNLINSFMAPKNHQNQLEIKNLTKITYVFLRNFKVKKTLYVSFPYQRKNLTPIWTVLMARIGPNINFLYSAEFWWLSLTPLTPEGPKK
jgi:hypothetical protein